MALPLRGAQSPESRFRSSLLIRSKDFPSDSTRPKAGLFRKALEQGWTPNESDAERETNAIKSTFAEWYDLARSYGIVIGCRDDDGVMMAQENTGNWYKFEEFSGKWTLEYLRRSLSHIILNPILIPPLSF